MHYSTSNNYKVHIPIWADKIIRYEMFAEKINTEKRENMMEYQLSLKKSNNMKRKSYER